MKKCLLKFLFLACALTTMNFSSVFAYVSPSNDYQQQQINQMMMQNQALMQQNEYLRQQTQILMQNQAYNQAYNQGYTEGHSYARSYYNPYPLYAGLGVGYVLGHWCFPRYRCGCHCGI